MMINSEKLMGRMSSKGTVLSEKSISNVGVIRRRLVDIDGMLKDKLVLAKVREGIRRQEEERLRRVEREDDIEEEDDNIDGDMDGGKRRRKKPKPKPDSDGALAPIASLLGGGAISIVARNLGLFRLAATGLKGVGIVASKTLMGAATAINLGYNAISAIQTKTLQLFGAKGLKILTNFQKVFSTFVNVAVVTAVTSGGLNLTRKAFKGKTKPLSPLPPNIQKALDQAFKKVRRLINVTPFGTDRGIPKSTELAEIKPLNITKKLSQSVKPTAQFNPLSKITSTSGGLINLAPKEMGLKMRMNFAGQKFRDFPKVSPKGKRVRKRKALDIQLDQILIDGKEEAFNKLPIIDFLRKEGLQDPKRLRIDLNKVFKSDYNEILKSYKAKKIEPGQFLDQTDALRARYERSILEIDTYEDEIIRLLKSKQKPTKPLLIKTRKMYKKLFENTAEEGALFFETSKYSKVINTIADDGSTFIKGKGLGGPRSSGAMLNPNLARVQPQNFFGRGVRGFKELLERIGGIPLVKSTRKLLNNTVGRIPFLGDLIGLLLDIFVFKEPIGRAAFMAIGGIIGGFLGAAIGSLLPGPGTFVGGLLGGIGGDIVGGAIYDLVFGGKTNPVEQTLESTTKKSVKSLTNIAFNGGGSVPDIGYSASYDKPGAGSVRFIPIPITSSSDTGSISTSSGGVFITKRKRSQSSLYAGGLIT